MSGEKTAIGMSEACRIFRTEGSLLRSKLHFSKGTPLAQMCREKISGNHVYADRSRHLSTASAMAFVQFTRIAGQDLFVRRMGLGRVAVPGLDGVCPSPVGSPMSLRAPKPGSTGEKPARTTESWDFLQHTGMSAPVSSTSEWVREQQGFERRPSGRARRLRSHRLRRFAPDGLDP